MFFGAKVGMNDGGWLKAEETEKVQHEGQEKWEEGTERGTKKEIGGERGETWQAVQRDVPLETENSPAPD